MTNFTKRTRLWGGLGAVAALAAAGTLVVGQQRQQQAPPAQQTPTAPASGAAARPIPTYQPLLDAKGRVKGEAFIPGPSLAAADRAYAEIDGAKMKGLVNEVVAISRRSRDDGNKYWGRIAGTKYEVMTADLIEA
jgi:hypothetical protein